MKFNESFSGTRTLQWQSISLWFLVAAAVGSVVWTLAVQPSSAQPVPTRIAFIDVQRVLGQSTAGRAATAKIKQLQESRMSRARVMDEELRKLSADLSAAGVTPARRSQLEGQISEKRIAMQRFAEDADKELGTTRARELQALESRIQPIVDSVGKEMQLAVIFNKFESGLVYANPTLDITETVITRFNAAAPAAPARP